MGEFIRAACYVRISTENQMENYSIEQQTDRLKAYCAAKDWNIYKFYTDAGYSGGNTERPALSQLMRDIEAHLIDIVVVYKLDRLSRSQKDTLMLIEDKFLKYGVDFVSMSENFDTSTPFGRAMIGILSVFAQLEKDQITERFTMGRIGRGKAGYYHGGPTPPTGYRYVDGLLVVDEYKAAQVREVFSLFLRGNSVNSIQRQMSEKYGGWGSHPLVLSVLRNSVYIGKVKFKGVEYDGIHKPIIDESTFFEAKELLSSTKRENTKTTAQKTPFRASYLLTSLIFCGNCGARYSGNHGFYKCYSRAKSSKRFIVDPNCKNQNLKIKEFDGFIISHIKELDPDSDYVKGLIAEEQERKSPFEDAGARITDIDAQISKLMDLYQIGAISIQDISGRIKALEKEKSGLSTIMTQSSKDSNPGKEFTDKLRGFNGVIENGSIEEKRLYISGIIERIIVYEDSIDIKWRI